MLYGKDQRAGTGSDADGWYGVAAVARWNTSKKFSMASRLKYYVDQSGFTTGLSQHLREATATLGYALHPSIATRLEYREEFSNRNFFGRAQSALSKQQRTVTLVILLTIKGER